MSPIKMLAIAYIDSLFSPLKREMVEQVAEIWNWFNVEIKELFSQAQLLNIKHYNDNKIEISRFQTFIDALNNFVQRRATLARFDTPVRIALGCVDDAQFYS